MKVADFHLLEEEEEQTDIRQVVHEFNQTQTRYPKESTIQQLFTEVAARTPDAFAVLAREQSLTYRELDAQSNRLAHFLVAQGICCEQAVGVMLGRSAEMIVALLGILKAGGCYLPLDPTLPASRARFILTEARCPFLISERRLIRTLNRLQWECPELRGFLCIDSVDVHGERESGGALMNKEMWDYVGREAFDDISAGGWRSSYSGAWLSREVMDEYGNNILLKLSPHLTPPTRILEVGCASGISMFRLAPRVGFYLGTDLSREITQWSETERRKRGLNHIRLQQVAAHEIDQLGETEFDIVIMNSVVQCFTGHNYFREVLRKAIALMSEIGVIFFGNIWDQELKEAFIESLTNFARTHAGKGYTTKIDRSEELFLTRDFFHDLQHEFSEIASVECSRMLGRHASEVSEYGFDVMVHINKRCSRGELPPRRKHQFDCTVLTDYPAAAIGERSHACGLANIIYTSGSTGQPKGVMIEHRAVIRLVRQTNYISLDGSDRILQTGSLAFDASTFEIWGALLNGAALCLPSGEDLLDARTLGRHIEGYGATTIFLTTGLFNVLVDTGVEIFRRLRIVLTGGERCSPAHFNKLRAACPDVLLKHLYGPTENTTFTTCYDVTKREEGNIPIGRPIANTTVYILDEQLKPLPVGVAGELCAGGDGLARGYLNDPDLTCARFVRHPFVEGQRLYRTGDICRWRWDGNVEFIGRRDNQVKIRGYRVELEEIEVCLCRHERVVDAVVLAQDIGGGNLELVAFVAGDDGLEMNGLREYLLATLPGHMVPIHLVKLDKLPLSANGKVDRKALQYISTQAGRASQHEAPATSTERQLASIWMEVLGHDGIGVTDDFFAAGGHSLRVTKLVALIRDRMDIALPLTAVFKATTIREQAKLLLEHAHFGIEEVDGAMVLLTKAAQGPSLFAFPPGTGDALGYLQLADLLKPYRFYGFNFLPEPTRLVAYADLIMGVEGEGPLVLLGYSAGGNLAYHVTAELERRGRHVSDIVMIDSSRRVRPLSFPEGEARRVAEAFLNHESIKPYVTSALLHDKANRLIERYYDFLSSTTDHHIVDANIHVLYTNESSDYVDPASGKLIAGTMQWSEVTRGRLATHLASGEHNHMLHTPNLEPNAQLLKKVLHVAFAAQQVCSNSAPAVH